MSGLPDGTVDRSDSPILGSPNAFKLACFSTNIGGGLLMSDVEGQPQAVWPEQVRIAQRAEQVGFEAMVPLARWRGHGGRTNPQHRTFETFTWAAGLAAVTERINIFATFHVPTVHPVMAAKMATTIDHISNGRFGMNIVAGWNQEELAMFGIEQRDHDQRYEAADEWTQVLKQMWETEGESDFHGRFFDVANGFSEPKPVQRPRPPLMSAGVSPAGLNFAATHCDMVFASVENPEKTAEKIAAIKAQAREQHGRELKVFATGYITCADTDEEAQAEYQRTIIQRSDWDAARAAMAKLMANVQSIDFESEQMQRMLESLLRAFFSTPLIGSPETIVRQLVELSEAGVEGMAITWSNFERGLDQYERDLLPLMVQAGLRAPIAATASLTPS